MVPTPQNIVSITYQLNKIVGDPSSILAQMPALTVQFQDNDSVLRTKAVSFQELRPYLGYLQSKAISLNKVIVCDPEKYYDNKIVFEIGDPSSSGVPGIPLPPTVTFINQATDNDPIFCLVGKDAAGVRNGIDCYISNGIGDQQVRSYTPRFDLRRIDIGVAPVGNFDVTTYKNGVLLETLVNQAINVLVTPTILDFDTVIITDTGAIPPTNTANWQYIRTGVEGSLNILNGLDTVAATVAGAIYQDGTFNIAAGDSIECNGEAGAGVGRLTITNTTDNDIIYKGDVLPSDTHTFVAVAGKAYSIVYQVLA